MKRLWTGMIRRSYLSLLLLTSCVLMWPVSIGYAQGVTTSSISGIVNDAQKLPVPGVTVQAVHEPSGTSYETVTRADGRFSIPSMRVGGPYTVTATLSGFQPQVTKDVYLNLGITTDLVLTLQTVAVTAEVVVVGEASPVFSSERTGAATAISREQLAELPTISNRLNDVARMTPQSNGSMQFAGQDNRMNNITVDGSYFNNSFGLAGTPGERTGVAPISLSAIEAVQVNIAPYDVRQGNFVGAGVNTVTRSGGNQWRGSAYYQYRDNGLVGTHAGDAYVNPGNFKFGNMGFWGSGPIMKNKAFVFANYEDESLTQPGTTFVANTGGQTVGGNTTRVLASDLDALSSYLSSNFGFNTGPYQGYDFKTPAKRFLTRVDYNISGNHKLSLRYNHLDSSTDVLVSNSSSLGWGSRRTNTTGLNFAGSNYSILENIRSFVGELNSVIGSNKSNTLIAGYTHQDESRGAITNLFPFVDVLEGSSVYTSFGSEPFTPNNELRYGTFQVQDNFSWFRSKHTYSFGTSIEHYASENVFFPGSQSVYVYNSLDDFYADANDYLANPNRDTSPITLRRFQVRWMNIPGMSKPVQPLKVWYVGAYAQDEWQAGDNLKVTYGLRFDVPFFGATGFDNAQADALSFMDANGGVVHYNTAKLPDANILWSPRVGFNWALDEQRRTQIRGGSGIFTGKPAYVWISNQIGNTGVLTGFESIDYTTARPFNPDPNAYKPATVTGEPASSYELALTEPNFKFPQIWRNSIAVDRKLPGGVITTAELLYSRDVNGISYINANLVAPSHFTGVDQRPLYPAGTASRINANVQDAIVLGNENSGSAWNFSLSAEKTFKAGFWIKSAYSNGKTKNMIDPGSIAYGSWSGNPISWDPNNPTAAYSNQGQRFYLAATYRFEYFNIGATSVSVFFETYNQGTVSYTYSGDLNRDGGTSNDLIYIPRDTSEMNFSQFTSGGVTYTPAMQAAAWEAYIEQDPYLSKHRGQYAERNGLIMPMVRRMDMAFTQDIFTNILGKRNSLQLRLDILNLGNLLDKNWGVGQRMVNAQPLTNPGVDGNGAATYRMRVISGQLMGPQTFQPTAGTSDVYRLQLSIRYTFN